MDLDKIYESFCLEKCLGRKAYEPYYQGKTGCCPNCQVDSFISYLEDFTEKLHDANLERVLKAAHYWLSNRPRGQAERTLSCGHVGPLGAPMCKACTKQALAALLEEIK